MCQKSSKVYITCKVLKFQQNINMMLTSKYITRFKTLYTFRVRWCSISLPQLSSDEEKKVLTILNEADNAVLKSYNFTDNRIKSLEAWKSKNGKLNTLNELIEIKGLGPKVASKFCEMVVNNAQVKAKSPTRIKKQVLYPSLEAEQVKGLNSAVSIHIRSSGLSWTRISRDYTVDCWNFYNFNEKRKKILPVDRYYQALEVLQILPCGDLYVMEGSGSAVMQNGSVVNLNQDLIYMLVALLNASPKHNLNRPKSEDIITFHNNVYFLKWKLPARLFRSLVGNEQVSSLQTVTNLVEGHGSELCSSINVKSDLKLKYLQSSSVQKEFLSQPLLLAITFMDVCINRRPESLKCIQEKVKQSK